MMTGVMIVFLYSETDGTEDKAKQRKKKRCNTALDKKVFPPGDR